MFICYFSFILLFINFLLISASAILFMCVSESRINSPYGTHFYFNLITLVFNPLETGSCICLWPTNAETFLQNILSLPIVMNRSRTTDIMDVVMNLPMCNGFNIELDFISMSYFPRISLNFKVLLELRNLPLLLL